jgi:hypothetical protein
MNSESAEALCPAIKPGATLALSGKVEHFLN